MEMLVTKRIIQFVVSSLPLINANCSLVILVTSTLECRVLLKSVIKH